MSVASASLDAPPTPSGLLARIAWHWRHNPRMDQWAVWWSIPVFYNIMGISYFVLCHMMPPPDPMKSGMELRTFLTDYGTSIQYGNALLMVALGFLVWANGLIAWLIMRMSSPGAKAWGFAYMTSMCGGSLTGAYMAAFTLSLGALRPDRNPVYTSVLYDVTYLSFNATMGFFLFGSLIWCVVILLDRNRIFPKWFGYTCIWNFTTEFLVGTVMIIPHGPFSWNGAISWYINASVYIGWQSIYAVVLFFAVRRAPVTMNAAPAQPVS